MERSINFVHNRRKKLTKFQANDLRIFKLTGLSFGILIVVFLAVFGASFYLKAQVANVKSEQQALERHILSREEVEQDVVVLTAKLKVILDLFDLRYDKQAAITYFSEIFGNKVLIKDISYDAGNKILSLRLRSESIFSLEEVFNKLAQPEVEEKFGLVNKSELTRNDEGNYGMAITLSLQEKEEESKPVAK